MTQPAPQPTPYTISIDTREQRPFAFASPLSDARRRNVSYTIQTVRATLSSGDYSLVGFESRVAVERKSLADLFSTLGQGRDRFVRELERLAALEFAVVVVEAEWSTVLLDPPRHSQLNPKTIIHSVIAWQVRYPRVHWAMLPNRDVAEAYTVRVLDRFWREDQAAKMEIPA